MKTNELILRACLPEEAEKMQAAYTAWNHKHVLPRSLDELREVAGNGLLFVLESDDEIVGATAVFDLDSTAVECGGTFVHPDFRGLGLQSIFFELRFAALIVYQGTGIAFTTAIDPSNADSLRNAGDFAEMAELLPAQLLPCADCGEKQAKAIAAGRQCCCDFFELPEDAGRRWASSLLRRTEQQIDLKRDDKSAVLSINCRVVTDEDSRFVLNEYAEGRWP